MLKLFLFILLIHSATFARWPFNLFEAKKPFMLILEASGDAATPGRTIFNNFENAVCFTIAQHIKQILDQFDGRAKICINRTPTELLAPLQNAQFANKLQADLYISIHCYQQTRAEPTISIYQYSYHEPLIIKKGSLGFYSYDQIYALNEHQTDGWAHEIKKSLAQQNHVGIQGVYKIPFKPLMGIEASAIGIEIGLNTDTNLTRIAYIISEALNPLMRR